MPSSVSKPTFTFFKLIRCGACNTFESKLFDRLVKDQEVLNVVNIDQVVFGQDESGTVYDLHDEYPDFVGKVKYAPYLWLSQPYDERTGNHLNEETMHDTSINTRLNGEEFSFRRDTTYTDLKQWILQGASKYRTFKKAGRGKKMN